MKFWQKWTDGGSDEENEEGLFDNLADVTPATPVPPAPPLPTPVPATPTEPQTKIQTPVAYTDIGIRYVLKTEMGEAILAVDDYENQLARKVGDSLVGISIEQVLKMQFDGGVLRAELFYLDGMVHKPVKPVDNPELRKLFFADYDRQMQPPAPPEEPPAPAEPPKPDSLVAVFASMSDEDRQALLDLLQSSKPAEPASPPPDPPTDS